MAGDLMWKGSVGEELHHLEGERAIHTDPEETRRRRTILLIRKNNSWGFTLQTYGIKNKKTGTIDVMTYVDYVEMNGPAWIAGMRKGDVLLSVNGGSVEGLKHQDLVAKIQESTDNLRLVVLFEDCCRKVELYERFIKLKRILSQKRRELRRLEDEEILIYSRRQLSRASMFRDSTRSSTSSDWDCYSEVASPAALESISPNRKVWQQHFFTNSTETLDTSSELSFDNASLFASHESLSHRASRESLSSNSISLQNNSVDSDRESFEKGAVGGCDAGIGDVQLPASTRQYLPLNPNQESIGMEAAILRQPAAREDKQVVDDAQLETHGGRKRPRSSSLLLNDMRMKLLADNVTSVASRAEKGSVNGENIEDEASDEGREACAMSEEKEAADCLVGKLYCGVRINDKDENTRL
ncbi:microtubule-associated serine/threonine-protein kinase 2-like isoform X4 [Pomacea canaliculata]|uniref:microtubule-associated serine/threonine-protein kinase 2-like isoform X4 n=1 Tax=Pomacea canaliculata TaxID=400727 RepID=UPI000D737772|nr:microtubule-associated serine/threonine-protein kinase 2-like isoform X4 [Pomacea canaliculata]